MRVYRVEFLQRDGRWTGPYCAETMTAEGFAIQDRLVARHTELDLSRPWPDESIFRNNPRENRQVCGTMTIDELPRWFGEEFLPLIREGGHLGTYDVPAAAVSAIDDRQIIYTQRKAILISRYGVPIPQERIVYRSWWAGQRERAGNTSPQA